MGTYRDVVLADSPVRYFRLGEASGSTMTDATGTSNGSYGAGSAAPTLGAAGALPGDPDTAAAFDGSLDFASAAVNLTSVGTFSLEFWLKWTTNANDDKLAAEFSADYNSNNGGFLVDPNGAAGKFQFAVRGAAGGINSAEFTRASTGVFHHYVLTYDSSQAAANKITPYVDGAAVSFTKANSGASTTLGNYTLYVMSRAGTSLFGAGTMDELALYTSVLSAARVAEHYKSASVGHLAPLARRVPPLLAGVR